MRRSFCGALLLVAAWTARATSQQPPAPRFDAFWIGGGAIEYSRPVADSIVLVLKVRFAPSGYLVDQSADYELVSLRCQGSRTRELGATAVIGMGAVEKDALQASIHANYDLPWMGDSTARYALLLHRCGRPSGVGNEVSHPARPTFEKHGFVPYWMGDRDVRFLRVTSDSTVLALIADFAPARSHTWLSATFEHFIVHCGGRHEYANVGLGDSEREALSQKWPVREFTQARLDDYDKDAETALVFEACIELARDRRRP